VCKNLFDIRSVFSSRQSTDKQVDGTGVSTVSCTGRFPQILWLLQWFYLPMQPFFGPHAVWYVSYQSLSRSWHTDLDYGSYRLSNAEIGLTAGVTGQQGMLPLPWHLIPPLIYSEVRVRPFSDLYFLQYLWDWLLCVIFVIQMWDPMWDSYVKYLSQFCKVLGHVGRSFGWDRKTRHPVSQKVRHNKYPSLLKSLERVE
jgi:hypothetical protein